MNKFQIGCLIGLLLFVGICIGSYWSEQSCSYRPIGILKEGHMHTLISNHSMINFYQDGRIVYANWSNDELWTRNNEIEYQDKEMVDVFSKFCNIRK